MSQSEDDIASDVGRIALVPSGHIVSKKPPGRPKDAQRGLRVLAMRAAYYWRHELLGEDEEVAHDWIRSHWDGAGLAAPKAAGKGAGGTARETIRRMIAEGRARAPWICAVEVDAKQWIFMCANVSVATTWKPLKSRKGKFAAANEAPDRLGPGWAWRVDERVAIELLAAAPFIADQFAKLLDHAIARGELSVPALHD